MPALDLVTYGGTNIGTTEVALAPVSGDSRNIRNFDPSKKAHILSFFAWGQGAGYLRFKSPRMHDNVANLQFDGVANIKEWLIPGVGQEVFAQDELNVTGAINDGAGDIQIAQALIYYDDLPGANGNYISWNDVKPRIRNILSVKETFAIGATFVWSGSQNIVADQDLLKANTNYAVLGFTFGTYGLSIAIRGTDTGNLRIGLPCLRDALDPTRLGFKLLSEIYGLPTIPIINSANKTNTYIEGIGNETTNGTDTYNLILAELAP